MAALADPHWETVTEEMRLLLRYIGQQPFSQRFYLAGGTALALRLGHRRSADLDFFSETDEVHKETREEIQRALGSVAPRVLEDVDGNLVLLAYGTRFGFFSYGYRLLEPLDAIEGVFVASLVDIGLMMLDALVGRGSRKDFYDLYLILQQFNLPELLDLARAKYPQARDFDLMVAESLVMFENAERDLPLELLVHLPWLKVQEFFIAQAQSLGRTWFAGYDP